MRNNRVREGEDSNTAWQETVGIQAGARVSKHQSEGRQGTDR